MECEDLISPQTLVDHQTCLVESFDQLCNELACPKLARAYGSDFHRAADNALPLAYSSDASEPKKGSLRVFAQQVRLVCVCSAKFAPTLQCIMA